jgi:uncharacterized protein YbjT (DUF2867 family)
MQTVIAGGHGKIALILTELLSSRGGRVRSLIRNPDHASDIRNAGGDPVVLDLESASDDAIETALTDCEAIVFAAGAGPGSSAERKETVDHQGAVRLMDAANRVGPKRYVIVSSTGADPDHEGDEIFDVYLRAKGKADRDLAASGLDFTIIRPVGLTDAPGSRRISVGAEVAESTIPRDDVAGVLSEVLEREDMIGRTFQLSSGEDLITDALDNLG